MRWFDFPILFLTARPRIIYKGSGLRIAPARHSPRRAFSSILSRGEELLPCSLRGDVGMSAITLAELRYGVEAHAADRGRNEPALEALLLDIPALPFDAPAARIYGAIRAAQRDGRRHALDRLIAAQAIGAGLTL